MKNEYKFLQMFLVICFNLMLGAESWIHKITTLNFVRSPMFVCVRHVQIACKKLCFRLRSRCDSTGKQKWWAFASLGCEKVQMKMKTKKQQVATTALVCDFVVCLQHWPMYIDSYQLVGYVRSMFLRFDFLSCSHLYRISWNTSNLYSPAVP